MKLLFFHFTLKLVALVQWSAEEDSNFAKIFYVFNTFQSCSYYLLFSTLFTTNMIMEICFTSFFLWQILLNVSKCHRHFNKHKKTSLFLSGFLFALITSTTFSLSQWATRMQREKKSRLRSGGIFETAAQRLEGEGGNRMQTLTPKPGPNFQFQQLRNCVWLPLRDLECIQR